MRIRYRVQTAQVIDSWKGVHRVHRIILNNAVYAVYITKLY